MFNQRKDNNKLKKKNQKKPELPKNQTAWNSDNQGVKEILIQTGRRNRIWKPGREDTWQVADLESKGGAG